MKKLISLVLSVFLIMGVIIIPVSATGLSDFKLAFYEDVIQDTENNTLPQDAQEIQSGQTVLGRLRLPVSWKGQTLSSGTVLDDYMDMDYFQFTLTEDSIVLLVVFPQTHKSDNYMMATISDESDSTLARTDASKSDDGTWLATIFDQPLSAGTYYITFLCSVDSEKYNGAEYMGYFEAIPASGPADNVSSPQSSGSLSNFTVANTYSPGQFTDVTASTWCADNVKTAFEFGLMAGKSDTYFDTEGNLTVAQAIVMSCRLHNIYYGNEYTFKTGTPWYQDYVDYALRNGIIDNEYDNYNNPISRAGFAIILNGALPDSALAQINTIEDQSIPDVPSGSNYYGAVYRLYRAGILTGNDSKGTFTPFTNISRGAAAAIVSRMADSSLRKNIVLTASYNPTSITLSASSQTIDVGKGFGLIATVLPAAAADKTITWSSSNRAVATVDNGYVYGIAPGTATITAKTVNGKTASCMVTVKSQHTPTSPNQDTSNSTTNINSFDFSSYAKNGYKAACVYAGKTIGVTELWGGFSPNRQYVYILLEDYSDSRLYQVHYKIGSTDNPIITTFRDTALGFMNESANRDCVWKELNIGVLL